MNIINLYVEQKSNDTKIYNSKIMKEYYKLCRFLQHIDISDEEIVTLIKKRISRLIKEDERQIKRVFSFIEYDLDFVLEKLKVHFPGVELAGIVYVIGEGNMDSHGLLIDGRPYVVIDVLTLANSIEHYDMEVFLTHEITHAIHYYLNPQMYFENYIGTVETYYKRIIAEGVATYISGELSSKLTESNYWLGFFDQKRTRKWKHICENEHGFFSNALKNVIIEDKIDEELYYSLFSVSDPNNLENSRFAYYYGDQICKILIKNRSYKGLLESSQEDWKNTFIEYFNLISAIQYVNYSRYGVT